MAAVRPLTIQILALLSIGIPASAAASPTAGSVAPRSVAFARSSRPSAGLTARAPLPAKVPAGAQPARHPEIPAKLTISASKPPAKAQGVERPAQVIKQEMAHHAAAAERSIGELKGAQHEVAIANANLRAAETKVAALHEQLLRHEADAPRFVDNPVARAAADSYAKQTVQLKTNITQAESELGDAERVHAQAKAQYSAIFQRWKEAADKQAAAKAELGAR